MEKFIYTNLLLIVFMIGFFLAAAKGLYNNEQHYFHGRNLYKQDAVSLLRNNGMWDAASLLEKKLN